MLGQAFVLIGSRKLAVIIISYFLKKKLVEMALFNILFYYL